jgi:hypothetical protein
MMNLPGGYHKAAISGVTLVAQQVERAENDAAVPDAKIEPSLVF